MPQPKQPSSAALKHLHRALIGSDPKRLTSLEEERFFAEEGVRRGITRSSGRADNVGCVRPW